MTTRRRRPTHALRTPDFGPPGPPYLPQIGQMYLVRTLVYASHDPAAARRAVVVTVPATKFGRIQLVTRTTKQVDGVPHAADLAIGCDEDGVFSELVGVEQPQWRSGNVVLLGVLREPTLSAVLEWAQ